MRAKPRAVFDHAAYVLEQRKAEQAEMRKAQLRANLQHLLGVLVGLCVLRPFALRYDEGRQYGLPWLTSSANAAADGKKQIWWIRFNSDTF